MRITGWANTNIMHIIMNSSTPVTPAMYWFVNNDSQLRNELLNIAEKTRIGTRSRYNVQNHRAPELCNQFISTVTCTTRNMKLDRKQ